jgi:hypothetical protein
LIAASVPLALAGLAFATAFATSLVMLRRQA